MVVEGQHWLLPAWEVNDDGDGWDSRQISLLWVWMGWNDVQSGFAPPCRGDGDFTPCLVISGFITMWSPVVPCALRPSSCLLCPASRRN